MAQMLRTRLPRWVLEEDLIGAGNLGLAAALARGDVSDPIRFDAFVVQHIRGAMLDELRRNDVMTRGQRQRARRVSATAHQLSAKLNRPVEHEEVAEAAGMTQDQYWNTLEAVQSAPVSLDWMMDVRGQVAAQSRSDHAPDLVADVRRTWERVCCEARHLSERERMVLDLELGQGMCPLEVARKLNVTKSRVSQLRNRAITHLREAVATNRASQFPRRAGGFGRPSRSRAKRPLLARCSLPPMLSAAQAPHRGHRISHRSLDLDVVVAATSGAAAAALRRVELGMGASAGQLVLGLVDRVMPPPASAAQRSALGLCATVQVGGEPAL
jgi:RNA polymerase sigma factor for flagellar operon FliA